MTTLCIPAINRTNGRECTYLLNTLSLGRKRSRANLLSHNAHLLPKWLLVACLQKMVESARRSACVFEQKHLILLFFPKIFIYLANIDAILPN